MSERIFDLQERTARYGEQRIELGLSIFETAVNRPLVSQLIRAATSVGANYCEADNAESRRDFRHKIALCRKEARESQYWCRMLAKASPDLTEPLAVLRKEAHELNLIFSAIFRRLPTP